MAIDKTNPENKNKALGHLWFEVEMLNKSLVIRDEFSITDESKIDFEIKLNDAFRSSCDDNFLLHLRNIIDFLKKFEMNSDGDYIIECGCGNKIKRNDKNMYKDEFFPEEEYDEINKLIKPITNYDLSNVSSGLTINNLNRQMAHLSWKRVDRDRIKNPPWAHHAKTIQKLVNERMKEFFEELLKLSSDFKIIKENSEEIPLKNIIDYLDNKIKEAGRSD
ncbi:hypothetical protein ACFL2A_02930 [Thermodesulfobacteriota bacterium]